MASTQMQKDIVDTLADLLYKQIRWRLQLLNHAWETKAVGPFLMQHYASKYACLPDASKDQLRRDAQEILKTLQYLGIVNDKR
jgi:hypothetical protein